MDDKILLLPLEVAFDKVETVLDIIEEIDFVVSDLIG